MQITPEVLTFLKKVVRTAELVDIDNIIIETGCVRAIDDKKTVLIFQENNIPILPFDSIGLNRTGVFTSRLQLAETRDNFTVDAILNAEGDQVISLTMKGAGMKIDYRCANPTTVKAPKKMLDTLKYRIPLNSEAVMLLQRAHVAMPQLSDIQVVTILSSKDGVSFELADSNNDVFSHTFTLSAENLVDGEPVLFANRYPVKTLLSLFKQNPEGFFDIGEKGILNVVVNDLNVFVLPQV